MEVKMVVQWLFGQRAIEKRFNKLIKFCFQNWLKKKGEKQVFAFNRERWKYGRKLKKINRRIVGKVNDNKGFIISESSGAHKPNWNKRKRQHRAVELAQKGRWEALWDTYNKVILGWLQKQLPPTIQSSPIPWEDFTRYSWLFNAMIKFDSKKGFRFIPTPLIDSRLLVTKLLKRQA